MDYMKVNHYDAYHYGDRILASFSTKKYFLEFRTWYKKAILDLAIVVRLSEVIYVFYFIFCKNS